MYLRLRDLVLQSHRDNMWVAREDLARRHLSGSGIEIGALTSPLRVPPGVSVRQFDRKSRDALLREDGPELAERGHDPRAIPEIDIVDDAEQLTSVADESVDFVIANHVLEHLEDPIGSLENLLRVIRPGGVLFLTLPDARHTFDARRARTSIEHLRRDHEQGPDVSRFEHYEEWARLIECYASDMAPARVAEFAREDARHHFHVWELEDFLELVRALELPCALLEARVCGIEFSVVLSKTADGGS
jgi:predicted SAM-dependent methyltransferase